LRTALTATPGIKALGEVGLDLYHGRGDVDRQRSVLAAQIELARELGLPVILHNRKSWPDFFGVLRDLGLHEMSGVCHNFTGSIEIARAALDHGLYLSFCGPVTYENATRIRRVARFAPLDRILTETDTPDLPCAKWRGRASRPFHVAEVVAALARIRELPAARVAEAAEENFHRLLGIAGNRGNA